MTQVRSSYLPHPMTEPFYRYEMTNSSWQELQSLKITFEELEKVDVEEIRELFRDD